MPTNNAVSKRITRLILAFMIVLLIGAFTFLSAEGDPETVLVVNGTEISRDAFYESLERFTINGELLGNIALRQLIAEVLVLQANETYQLGVTDQMVQAEFEAVASAYGDELPTILAQMDMTEKRLRDEIKLSLIIDRLVTKDVQVTDDEVRAFYEANMATLFMEPELYRASQILVETEEEALQILEELAAGADFSAIRAERSLDTADWAAVAIEDPVPTELAKALFSLEVGEVSEPVKTASGYYLIRLEEILPEEVVPFESVVEEIRQYLLYSRAISVDDAIAELWSKASIEVHWERYGHLANQSE